MKIETSPRYGVIGIYFDRETKTNLPWLHRRIVRVYPLPFVRVSFNGHWHADPPPVRHDR